MITKEEAERRLVKRLAEERIVRAQATIDAEIDRQTSLAAIVQANLLAATVRLVGVSARDVETLTAIYRDGGWNVNVLGAHEAMAPDALQDTIFFRVS